MWWGWSERGSQPNLAFHSLPNYLAEGGGYHGGPVPNRRRRKGRKPETRLEAGRHKIYILRHHNIRPSPNLNEQLQQQSEASRLSRRRRRRSDNLLRHAYQHHPVIETENLTDLNLNEDEGMNLNLMRSNQRGTPADVVTEVVFKCPYCLVVFPGAKKLIRHLGTHHNLYPKKTVKAGKTLPSLPVKKEDGQKQDEANSGLRGKPSYIKVEMPYSCSRCTRRFALEWTLKIHLLSHSAKRNYQCQTCERRFKQPCSLSRHVKLKHS